MPASTNATTIRILRSQIEALEKLRVLRGTSTSALIRVLLAEYFEGRMPQVNKLLMLETVRSTDALHESQFKKKETKGV